ncbi:esterase-like activity of phytase family protein [Corynebacterium jeikeium]|uniref:esterase-like activity of phytase family protein n=1 Tax=Corynebacterium jeikeium TaxID=38289 RepID=UPI000555C5FC|nr:esterase-like activity of phytase family protein [Corynebacterium jeikeium]
MQLNNFKNSVSQRAQRKVAGISLALAVIPFAAVPAANATVGSQAVVGSTLGSSGFGSSAGSSAGSTAGSSLPGSSGPAGSLQPGNPGNPGTPDAQSTFERTVTYPVYENRPDGEDKSAETVAEISTVSKDGKTLIHTDALAQRIGFIDISDPNAPKGLGTLDLKAQGHAKDEPTSVAVYGDYLLVVIDETAGDFANPKGRVDIVRISDRTRVSSIDLKGQPDSIAISPAGAPGKPTAAIAMENQRDEDLNDGNLPQLPTGFVQTIDLSGDAKDWKATPIRFEDDNGKLLDAVKKAGLDTPEDLEPEYVSINGKNQLAVTLQENNGVAIIDLQTNRITNVFSAGSAEVKGVDTQSDKLINPTDTLPATPREPDAIAWIDDNHVATANEGDWKSGTRGWTVFDASGKIVWDAGNSVENLAIRHGLHNNKRAKKKGVEIEGIATAKMNGTNYAFVGSERSNFVAVYNVNDPANPQFVQMLFTTNGPEGILPIPERNMLAVSSEVDEADNAVRSAVTLYRLGGEESQPSIVSADQGDAPIGWGALGALTADPKDANRLYAASDSAYANGWVYTIDASKQPAVITERRAVKRDGAPAEDLDIEGISVAADGGFWIASEGKKGKDNRLFHTDKDLNITSAVELPADVAEHIGKWGLEGVSSTKDENGVEQLFVAVQRPLWKDPEAKDREALEGDNTTRIGKYDTKTKQWQWFGYELEKSAGKGDWMGLSEITALDDKHLLVIERDKLNGPDAKVKRVMKVTLPEGSAEGAAAGANGDASGGALPMVNKELAVDVLPKLRATNGWTQEKLEGFTIAADGQMYAVTDNDALEDATGETVFLRLGKVK